MKRLLLAGLLALLTAATSAPASDGGFLFVTFTGEATPLTEQIYFAISQDGRHWDALNDAKPVLVSQLGEQGVRDPYILRSHDGKKVYLLATDLSINRHHGWERATHAGSKSLVIWESDDLTHWSQPVLAPVAAPDAGCAWAPEAVYDEDTQDYLVFWASTTASDNFAKQRIWACRTKDFHTFGAPFVYIDKAHHVIDADIVREGGKYYRFAKDESVKAVTMEVSEKLLGPWTDAPQFSLAGLKGYEGPECFLLEPGAPGKPSKWCLLLDFFSRGKGYFPYVTDDLAGGQFTAVTDFRYPFLFRHGSVLAITATERDRLNAAYGGTH